MADNTVKTGSGIEVYTHEIYRLVDQYRLEKDIEDLCKISQGRWNCVLFYIYDYYFKGKDIIKQESNINNAYDTGKVNAVCDIYIRLCCENDKEVSIMGFCKMTGITQDTIFQWANENTQPGSFGSEVYKKLNREREESLSNKLASGANPVGILGILNHNYNWNMPGVREQRESKPANLEQIKQQYLESKGPAALEENEVPITPPAADF